MSKSSHAHAQRSNVHNPNNAAHRAAANNHANQGNPNNAAHPSADQPQMPAPRAPTTPKT